MHKKTPFSFLTSFHLKIIALSAMTLDHVSVVFFGTETTLLRNIGRLCFPLIAFMISEGVRYTKNKRKYILSMGIFALISEIPYNLAFYGGFSEIKEQNVYFTLFFGVIAVSVTDELIKNKKAYLAVFVGLFTGLAAYFFGGDYGFMGIIVCMGMYLSSLLPMGMNLIGYAISALLTTIVFGPPLNIGYRESQLPAVLAVIPIMLYNGKKGMKLNKYLFYGYYPLHLIILYAVHTLLA